MYPIYQALIAGGISITLFFLNSTLSKHRNGRSILEKRYVVYDDIFNNLYQTQDLESSFIYLNKLYIHLSNKSDIRWLFDTNSKRYLRNIIQYHNNVDKCISKKLLTYNLNKFYKNIDVEFSKIRNQLGYPTSTYKEYLFFFFSFVSFLSFSYLLDNSFSRTFPEYSTLTYIVLFVILFSSLIVLFLLRKNLFNCFDYTESLKSHLSSISN